MNYEKMCEQTLDYFITTIAQLTEESKKKWEEYLDCHVNDYVRHTFPELTEEETNKLINDVVKQYFLL